MSKIDAELSLRGWFGILLSAPRGGADRIPASGIRLPDL